MRIPRHPVSESPELEISCPCECIACEPVPLRIRLVQQTRKFIKATVWTSLTWTLDRLSLGLHTVQILCIDRSADNGGGRVLILSTKALGGEYCPVQGLRASQRLIPHWCKLDQDARGDARRELLEEATPTPPPIERFRLVHRYREGISRGRFTGQFACSVLVVDCNMAEAITLWRDLARVDVSTTPAVEAIAEAIAERGVKAMDALHVASAITAGATWLLTTDLKLIRKMHGDDRIVVAGPIDFIRYWQGDDDENRV